MGAGAVERQGGGRGRWWVAGEVFEDEPPVGREGAGDQLDDRGGQVVISVGRIGENQVVLLLGLLEEHLNAPTQHRGLVGEFSGPDVRMNCADGGGGAVDAGDAGRASTEGFDGKDPAAGAEVEHGEAIDAGEGSEDGLAQKRGGRAGAGSGDGGEDATTGGAAGYAQSVAGDTNDLRKARRGGPRSCPGARV